jgi:CxxC motif-containing protein (DUF1111 family)
MHDLGSVTYGDAIRRHGREAGQVVQRFNGLSDQQRGQLITFLSSL